MCAGDSGSDPSQPHVVADGEAHRRALQALDDGASAPLWRWLFGLARRGYRGNEWVQLAQVVRLWFSVIVDDVGPVECYQDLARAVLQRTVDDIRKGNEYAADARAFLDSEEGERWMDAVGLDGSAVREALK